MNAEQKYQILLSILSMDSYNRGYGAGLVHGQNQIGNAVFDQDKGDASAQATGFYAASYDTPNGIVISYRGTDASPDYTRGWSIALGVVSEGTQAPQALEFYSAVLNGKTYQDGRQENVILTGHSLGGMLAGYVAALSGTDAYTFDHAPFGLGAIATYLLDHGIPANVTDLTEILHLSQIHGDFVDNEILESARNGDVQVALGAGLSILPVLGQFLQAYGYSNAAITTAIEAFVSKNAIDSHSGISELSANPLTLFALKERALKLHMMDYLVNLKYAGLAGFSDWFSIGPQFAESYFNNDLARSVGFKEANDGGTTAPAGKMGRAIAYSALEKGGPGLVFGDSAVRTLFDDLDEIGGVYSRQSLDALLLSDLDDTSIVDLKFDTTVRQAFVDVATQYAAALAAYKIQVAQANAAVDGLDIEKGVFGSGIDHNTIALDYSSILWEDVFKRAGKDAGDDEGVDPKIVHNPAHSDRIRTLYMSQFAEFLQGYTGFQVVDYTAISKFVEAIWDRESSDIGGANYKAIDRFHFRVPADTYEIVMSDRSYKVKDGYGDQVHIDAYHGSEYDDVVYSTLGNDLIFVDAGNDTVYLRGGRDYVQAGAGNDVLVDRMNVNLAQSPLPSDVPANAPFDDIFAGLTADENKTPWETLLKAYQSNFVEADEYRYSVAKTPERLQAENAGPNEQSNPAKLNDLKNPKYDRKGVYLSDLRTFEGLTELASQQGFEYLAKPKIEVSVTNLNNGISEKDILIGVEKLTLTEGADIVRLAEDDYKFPLLIDLGKFAPEVGVDETDYDFVDLAAVTKSVFMVDGVLTPHLAVKDKGGLLGLIFPSLEPGAPFPTTGLDATPRRGLTQNDQIKDYNKALDLAETTTEAPDEATPLAFTGFEHIKLTAKDDVYVEAKDRDGAGSVRVQRQLDRMHDLNNGGFLAHRSRMENEDETEIRSTSDVVRTGCEGHKAGHTETVFS
jgi:RTX calcium-binding nonapeptide repeat (4 copies)/Protein of unknown function (DUF2974)